MGAVELGIQSKYEVDIENDRLGDHIDLIEPLSASVIEKPFLRPAICFGEAFSILTPLYRLRLWTGPPAQESLEQPSQLDAHFNPTC